MSALLIHNARLATPISNDAGAPAWEFRELYPAALYCEDDRIVRVGEQDRVLEELPACDEIDAGARLLTPGLVDCHTHPVFLNHRAHEFVQRTQGTTYQEIAAGGGGIRYSVRDLRAAAEDDLRQRVLQRIEILESRAKDVPEKELDEVLGAGYGIFSGKDVKWAKLRFTPERARWVAAERWHSKQKGAFEPDGSYLLEVPFSHLQELMMDILRHGAAVEVVAPASLQNRVAEEAKAIAGRYGK